MNTSKYRVPTSNQSNIKVDNRIYDDSLGRPVGLTGRVNRITNLVEVPNKVQLFTPEDKIKVNQLFDRIISTIENITKPKM